MEELERSLDKTQTIIAFRSSSNTNFNDVIIKNNTELTVFGNVKSTDILTTDTLHSLCENRCGHATVSKATETMSN